MKKTPMRRTNAVTPHLRPRTRAQTPHLLPDPHRTPLATLSNTSTPQESKRRFRELDSETDEELEEPVEKMPSGEVRVKLEKKTPMKRKGKELGDSTSSSCIVVHPPGRSMAVSGNSRPGEDTLRPNRRVPKPRAGQGENKLDPVFPVSSTPIKTTIATPYKKEPKPKVSIPPSAPKKSPSLRPTSTRSSTVKPISQVGGSGINENQPDSVFKLPTLPSKAQQAVVTQSSPKKRSTVDDSKSDALLQMEGGAGSGNEEMTDDFFDPDGIIRDIYVQGSEMIVKVKVEKAIYVDGSPSDPSEEISAHIAATLLHFMVPYLHNLTFQHTGPMASEAYLKDHPVIYHIERKAHGAGNTFKRSRTVKCFMWEEIVVITPYLVQDSEKTDEV